MGPHPHDLSLATFGRSAMCAATIRFVQRLSLKADPRHLYLAASRLGVLRPNDLFSGRLCGRQNSSFCTSASAMARAGDPSAACQ